MQHDKRFQIRVGFTCGAFDLLHAGHIMMFKEAKEQCDWLVVGLQVDPSLDRESKNKPIQTLEERKTQVEAVKFIDEVVVYETEAHLLELLRKLSPDVRIIGADHKGKKFTGWELPIEIYFNSRNHNFSTSELRKRIYESEKNNA
jgi:glycerol-3-phosphate cytidylyltransferase